MRNKVNRRAFLVGGGTVAAVARSASAQNVSQAAKRPSAMYDDIDVLVVGGGPAGIGAALGAARTGVKTLLIENHAFFGGVASYSLGMPIFQMRPDGKPRSDVHELLIEKLFNYGDLAVQFQGHGLSCNVDYLKVAVLDALDEVGCNYLVHTQAVDTIVEGNRVAGVVVGTKQGPRSILAKTTVDCTGDADVAYFAGAETMKEVGSLSPLTLQLKITNVDMRTARGVNMMAVAEKAREKYPLIPKYWGLSRSPSSNSFYINHACTRDFGEFDGTDPEQLTKAESFARRQALQMVHAMREFGGKPLENVELIGTSPQIGVRETRRVKGGYVLTYEDAKTGRQFDDVVAWRGGRLDIGFVRNEPIKTHDVPYRAILPERTDGLLTAGRCISATHVAASAGKSMGICVATGHAAGLAAALSAKKGIVPRDLDVAELQTALRADNVDLDRSGKPE